MSIASRFFGFSGTGELESAATAPATERGRQPLQESLSRYYVAAPPSSLWRNIFRDGLDTQTGQRVVIQTINSAHNRLQFEDVLKLKLQLLLRKKHLNLPGRIQSTTQQAARDVHLHLLEWIDVVQGPNPYQLHIIQEHVEALQPLSYFLETYHLSSPTAQPTTKRHHTATASFTAPLAFKDPKGFITTLTSQLFPTLLHLHRQAQLLPEIYLQWTVFFLPEELFVHPVRHSDGSIKIRLKIGSLGLCPLSFSSKRERAVSGVGQDYAASLGLSNVIFAHFNDWASCTKARSDIFKSKTGLLRSKDVAAAAAAAQQVAQSPSAHSSSPTLVVFVPPEQLDPAGLAFLFGETVTVWFLGIFLYQLCSGGRLPYLPQLRNQEQPVSYPDLFLRICTWMPSSLNFANVPSVFQPDLIAMLRPDPLERMSLEDLCNSPAWLHRTTEQEATPQPLDILPPLTPRHAASSEKKTSKHSKKSREK